MATMASPAIFFFEDGPCLQFFHCRFCTVLGRRARLISGRMTQVFATYVLPSCLACPTPRAQCTTLEEGVCVCATASVVAVAGNFRVRRSGCPSRRCGSTAPTRHLRRPAPRCRPAAAGYILSTNVTTNVLLRALVSWLSASWAQWN